MSSLKVTLCAGAAAAAAMLLPTVHAFAEDGGGKGGSVSVTPETPTPGAEVVLRVSGCGGKTATAASTAFVADARLVVVGTGGTLVGETRVRSSITAGTYDVRITCVDFQVKGRITIVAPGRGPSQSPARPTVPGDTPASPVAPVHAGGGGTAPLAAADEARVEGPGTAQTVTGLVLAGVAAAVVAYRGTRATRAARRGRGTG
ncbi:hypothetical protein [Streptomyces sp. DSM 15324]|uniref:hypothetical protein n=1 Tax=Streptomyces sp. DSM 15324 TaxID=1739111 RepID=UPI0007489FCB|nr:hypothetical protein [Streptomyces sp. DSM 15324]KUO13683.1 hypothetical protein AQJ58_00870 [Streptomyces sp. DSM 15324]